MIPVQSTSISWNTKPTESTQSELSASVCPEAHVSPRDQSRTGGPLRAKSQQVATLAAFLVALSCATIVGGPTLVNAADTPSGPVGGYREFKFGASKDEVKAAQPCSLAPAKLGENGLTILECWDFLWAGGKVNAGFGFLDGKLMTIAINVPKGKAPGTFEALAEKYGSPSSSSSRAQFALADVPGNTASVCFAADTVCAAVWWDGLEQVLALQYKAKDLDTRVKDLTKRAVQPDL